MIDTATESITLVRVIAAPVSAVFTAWTDPTVMRQWLVPIFCKIVEVDADARPGGRMRMVIKTPFGGRHVMTGEYREVVPNRRLVQTWVMEGKTASDAYPTLLKVEFREVTSSSTEITLHQSELRTPRDAKGNTMGWKMCLKKLERALRW